MWVKRRSQPEHHSTIKMVVTGTSPSERQKDDDGKYLVNVVIIGAGISGLQAAASLLDDDDESIISLVVLEARNRIGGRIFSDQEKRTQVHSCGGKAHFLRDHGASWVHGTGHSDQQNPIVRLLEGREGDDDCDDDDDDDDDALIPIFDGNPWTRPDLSLIHI